MNRTRMMAVVMCFAVTAAPIPVSAQIGGTLGKILNGLGKVGSTPPPIQLVGKPVLQGGDTAMAARFRLDTVTTRIASTSACGTARVCAPGWDLRLVSVTVPAAELPAQAAIPVTVEIVNRGRVSSPASEVQLCSGTPGATCQSELELIPLPPLASGERMHIVRHALTGSATDQPIVFSAVIDPDNSTGEVNRANNTAVSVPAKVAVPALEIVGLQPDAETAADGTIGVAVAIRNPSFNLPSPQTTIRFGDWMGEWGGNPLYSLDFPALAPRQVMGFNLRIFGATSTEGSGRISLSVDPDRKEWPNGGPTAKSAEYKRVR